MRRLVEIFLGIVSLLFAFAVYGTMHAGGPQMIPRMLEIVGSVLGLFITAVIAWAFLSPQSGENSPGDPFAYLYRDAPPRTPKKHGEEPTDNEVTLARALHGYVGALAPEILDNTHDDVMTRITRFTEDPDDIPEPALNASDDTEHIIPVHAVDCKPPEKNAPKHASDPDPISDTVDDLLARTRREFQEILKRTNAEFDRSLRS